MRSGSHSYRLHPRETDPCAHRIGDEVGLKVSVDDVEKKNSWIYWESNSKPSVVQPAAIRYTEWTIPAQYGGKC